MLILIIVNPSLRKSSNVVTAELKGLFVSAIQPFCFAKPCLSRLAIVSSEGRTVA